MRWWMTVMCCATLVATGCGGDATGTSPTCSAGATQLCDCLVDGQVAEGIQECEAGGAAWGACQCGSGGTDDATSGGTDDATSGGTDDATSGGTDDAKSADDGGGPDPDTDPPVCAPDCDDKACGDDGCGGSCGTCDGGDLCNGTLVCVVSGSESACVVDQDTVVVCSETDSPCTVGLCDPATGECAPNPVDHGAPCGDDDLCNGLETCQAGECTDGTPLDCDDDDLCTTDSCEPSTGCTHTPVAGECDEVPDPPGCESTGPGAYVQSVTFTPQSLEDCTESAIVVAGTHPGSNYGFGTTNVGTCQPPFTCGENEAVITLQLSATVQSSNPPGPDFEQSFSLGELEPYTYCVRVVYSAAGVSEELQTHVTVNPCAGTVAACEPDKITFTQVNTPQYEFYELCVSGDTTEAALQAIDPSLYCGVAGFFAGCESDEVGCHGDLDYAAPGSKAISEGGWATLCALSTLTDVRVIGGGHWL